MCEWQVLACAGRQHGPDVVQHLTGKLRDGRNMALAAGGTISQQLSSLGCLQRWVACASAHEWPAAAFFPVTCDCVCVHLAMGFRHDRGCLLLVEAARNAGKVVNVASVATTCHTSRGSSGWVGPRSLELAMPRHKQLLEVWPSEGWIRGTQHRPAAPRVAALQDSSNKLQQERNGYALQRMKQSCAKGKTCQRGRKTWVSQTGRWLASLLIICLEDESERRCDVSRFCHRVPDTCHRISCSPASAARGQQGCAYLPQQAPQCLHLRFELIRACTCACTAQVNDRDVHGPCCSSCRVRPADKTRSCI